MSERVRDGLSNGIHERLARFGEPVVHPQAVAPRLDETGTPKIGEVSRRFWLRDLQAFMDIADADLPRQQQTENAEARRIGEGLEETFDRLHLRRHIFVLTNIPQRH